MSYIIKFFPLLSSFIGKTSHKKCDECGRAGGKSMAITFLVLVMVIYAQYLHGKITKDKYDNNLERVTLELKKAEDYITLQNIAIETNENYYNSLEERIKIAKQDFEKTLQKQEIEMELFLKNSLEDNVNCDNVEQVLLDGIEDLSW